MKLPEIDITHANIWKSPDLPRESPPRFVTHYELELCLTDGAASSIDERRMELRRGMMIFARPGQIRHSRLPFTNAFIYFDSQPHTGWDALLARIPDFSLPDEHRTALFEKLLASFRKDPLLSAALLIELLSSLACSEPVAASGQLRPGQAEIFRAIRYMKSRLNCRLSVSELAAQAGYSPSHFTVQFRALTGATPYEYFQALRLKESKRLLCEGVSISETAQQLAFSSASHFCASFRRSFGLTPTEFARQGRLTDYEIER